MDGPWSFYKLVASEKWIWVGEVEAEREGEREGEGEMWTGVW